MANTRLTTSSCALVILWVACTATPVTPQIATKTSPLLRHAASRGMVLACPVQGPLMYTLLSLESSQYTATQPAPKSSIVLKPWSQAPVNVELQVPEVLMRALLMEDEHPGPVELHIPEALPMVLTTED
jgi:hypothetical protein